LRPAFHRIQNECDLSSEILHVDVSSEPDVIGEIPSVVVGIFVDYDVVSTPIPVAAEPDVKGGNAEVEATEPEASGASAGQVPDVPPSESSGKTAVFPRMVEMKTGIIVSVIVADPLSVVMDVGSLRVAFEVASASPRGLVRSRMNSGRTVLWDETTANGVPAVAMLRPQGKRENESDRENFLDCSHDRTSAG
jgi:hypothetical protein